MNVENPSPVDPLHLCINTLVRATNTTKSASDAYEQTNLELCMCVRAFK